MRVTISKRDTAETADINPSVLELMIPPIDYCCNVNCLLGLAMNEMMVDQLICDSHSCNVNCLPGLDDEW